MHPAIIAAKPQAFPLLRKRPPPAYVFFTSYAKGGQIIPFLFFVLPKLMLGTELIQPLV